MIRLISVVGHGVDLMPHFINHYKNYVDEIQLVIYETDEYPNISNQVKDIIKDYDFVKIVKTIKDRIFDNDFINEYTCEFMIYIKNDYKL